MTKSTFQIALLTLGLTCAQASLAAAEGLCDTDLANRGVAHWTSGQYLYNCTVTGATPALIRIPAQPVAYLLEVAWGGYDKSNGAPTGQIKLYVGTDGPFGTTMKHQLEAGDDEKTWRWNGLKDNVKIPANTARTIRVAHDTANGTAGNTYLRVKFAASD